MINLGRDMCSNAEVMTAREWLVTNGIGGYACGTLAGILARCYHGLLVAALEPPLGRNVLLAKVEETVEYDGQSYPLYANQRGDGLLDAPGLVHLERFHLEGSIPVWTYACADALLEKRIWMEQGANTTYIHYALARASLPLRLTIKPLVNYRDHHTNTIADSLPMAVTMLDHGLRIDAFADAAPFYLLSDSGMVTSAHDWERDFYQRIDEERGLDAHHGDHLNAGQFEIMLHAGETLTLVASTDVSVERSGRGALLRARDIQEQLIEQAQLKTAPEPIQQLILAADQFIVRRPTRTDPEGRTVIAGYPWFGDWGRDTMISLPGLTLATGRPEVARRILRTFAEFIDQGMLPNRFPDASETPEYNTVDATLWYFQAIRMYHDVTGDTALLRELFPALEDIIRWHVQGTRYQIHVDPADGLIYSGEPGVQLTWMDAKVGDWVVTPRTGKAIEINALWYNALLFMVEAAQLLGLSAENYSVRAKQVQVSFQRYWNDSLGYCYDVLDTPTGNDPALRPNQLFAISLRPDLLTPAQARQVVDQCARQLYTAHGLRSLAPSEPAYLGQYHGNQRQRDAAYHQGTVWGWLIGPFVEAYYRVYGNAEAARQYLDPLLRHVFENSTGTLSEIFEGDPPFAARGCFAQAWTVAEVLRVWHWLSHIEAH